MQYRRIIPRLDIKGPNLVKGIHLEGLRVLGKPEDFASAYFQQGADELIFQDVVASLYQRNQLDGVVSRMSEEVFIPITVGGGIRSLEDIERILRAGADKVAINTAAIRDRDFIGQAVRVFGSSTIVVTIEALAVQGRGYVAYTDNGREDSGLEVQRWAKEVEDFGAGEILLTSIDREGTGKGCDLTLVNEICETVSIPVVAHGGAGSADDVVAVFQESTASGIAAASMFHYPLLQKSARTDAHESEGNVDFLMSQKGFKGFAEGGIPSLKQQVMARGISLR